MPNIILYNSWGGNGGDPNAVNIPFDIGPFFKANKRHRSIVENTCISNVYIMKGTVPTDINNYSVPTNDILINFTSASPNGTLKVHSENHYVSTAGDYTQAVASGTATHFLFRIPPGYNEGTDPYWLMDTTFSLSGQSITAGAFYRLNDFRYGKIEVVATNGVISY